MPDFAGTVTDHTRVLRERQLALTLNNCRYQLNRGSMLKGAVLLFSIICSAACYGETAPPSPDVSFTESINLMSDCSGTWKFFSMMQDLAGNPATSKQMKELHFGAALAAQFLLQSESAARTGVPKDISSFERYVRARQDVTETALMAYLEQGAVEALESQMDRCVDALRLQESIIQMMRDSAYRN